MTRKAADQPQQGVSIEQALGMAHAHWDAGQAEQAEMLCQQVLGIWPGNSDAHHLLGLMAHAYGNLDLAIDNLRKACQSPRTPPLYLSNLAEMCRQRGLLAEAEQAGRAAIRLDQTLPGAWNNLGIILQEAGKLDESRSCLERVVLLRPGEAEGYNNLGNTLKRLGQLDQARQRYEAALALAPNYAEAHSNLSNLLNDLGRPDEALASARRAIDANPRLADAYVNAAAAEVSRNRYREALRWIDMLLAFAPMHPGGLMVRAVALRYLEQWSDALNTVQLALSIAPGSSEVLNALGEILQGMGRTDEALAAYQRAIAANGFASETAAINRGIAMIERGDAEAARVEFDRAVKAYPRSAAVWLARSDLKTFKPGDPDLAAMAALLGAGGVEARNDRIALNYALAKGWMDAGDAGRAMAALNEGSRLKRATFNYDPDSTDRWLAGIAEAVTPAFQARLAGGGAASDLPVFVLGMPRSGTSLIEQILASHPEIHAAGELQALSEALALLGPIPQSLSGLTPEVATQMGRQYLDAIAPLALGRTRVVDKMPSNFFYAGLIPTLLPQARIIHVRRDPIDTCLSCYTKLFAREQLFSYDLAELGRFYRAYERLMAHWRAILPADRFLEVRYEDVVADLETQARKMISFLDLPWADSCLRFHETGRVVRTASALQVRKPLFATSIDRWKPYAAHLAPLFATLDMPMPDV